MHQHDTRTLLVNERKLADSQLLSTCVRPLHVGAPFAKCIPKHFDTGRDEPATLVKNVDNCLYAKPRWELCEDFGCAYMTCRALLGDHLLQVHVSRP
jgi:hypothetical protein